MEDVFQPTFICYSALLPFSLEIYEVAEKRCAIQSMQSKLKGGTRGTDLGFK
jgi:hypothetical protein